MTFEPERPVMVLAGLRKGIYGLRPQNRQIRSFKDPRIAGFLKEPYLVFLRSLKVLKGANMAFITV
jgi:hypothetical protein